MIAASFVLMAIEIDDTFSLEDLLTVNSLKYRPPSVASQPLISHTTVHVYKRLRGWPSFTHHPLYSSLATHRIPYVPCSRFSRSASKQLALKRVLLIEINLNRLIALK
jgi:hypothetical protein